MHESFQASYRVYCLIGDGESAEGSIWEAIGIVVNHSRTF